MQVKPEKSDRSRAARRAKWIADTQMFQRISGVQESNETELGIEYDNMKAKSKRYAESSAESHLMIAQAARQAGENRKN